MKKQINLKKDYPIIYEVLIQMLEAYGINTNSSFYKYLNKEYDLKQVYQSVFGMINQDVTFELIIAFIESTLEHNDYNYILEIEYDDIFLRSALCRIIEETFYINELCFLSTIMNDAWIKDLNNLGYISEQGYNTYKLCIKDESNEEKTLYR